MPASQPSKPKTLFRRAERWGVGVIMSLMAFVIERAVIRSIRKGETKAKPPAPTALKGTGADIEPDTPAT